MQGVKKTSQRSKIRRERQILSFIGKGGIFSNHKRNHFVYAQWNVITKQFNILGNSTCKRIESEQVIIGVVGLVIAYNLFQRGQIKSR
jgi:hypothetical protein